MPEQRSIPVADLALDPRNPRLEEGLTTQREALRSMLQHLGKKILVLAGDIVEFGINPTERFIVIPDDDVEGRFTVLEGNRRLTALKILETPSLAEEHVSPSIFRNLGKLSQEYSARPIKDADCWIADSREEAAHWMQLRHESGHEGAGVESWGTVEKERFASWRSGAPTAAMQILSVVAEHGRLDDSLKAKVREVPTSTVMRVVQTPDAAKILGIEYNRRTKELRTHFPEEEIAKGLARLLTDLVEEKTNSRELNTAAAIRGYVSGFPKKARPKQSTKLPKARALNVTVSNTSAFAGGPAKRSRKRGTGGPRSFVVPRELKLSISHARLADIFRELKALRLDRHANSVAVLLRVFIELSADHYIEAEQLKSEHQLSTMSLREKLLAVAADLRDEGKITKQQSEAIRRAAQDQHLLAAGARTFHAYVHNRHVVPQASELRAAWDQLQSFVEGVWA